MNFDDLYPGRFLKAGSLPGGVQTLTVANVFREAIETDTKVIVTFHETPLQLVLPKVNGVAIKAMFGSNVRNWINRRITFYATTAIMPYPKRPGEPCVRIWGSPDLTAPVSCEWQPPKRKAIIQVLRPSGALSAALEQILQRTPEQIPELRPWIDQLGLSADEMGLVESAIQAR